jgi:hypothetical protein
MLNNRRVSVVQGADNNTESPSEFDTNIIRSNATNGILPAFHLNYDTQRDTDAYSFKPIMPGSKGVTMFSGMNNTILSDGSEGAFNGLEDAHIERYSGTFIFTSGDTVYTYVFVGKVPLPKSGGHVYAKITTDVSDETRDNYHVTLPDGTQVPLDEMRTDVYMDNNTVTPWTAGDSENESYLILRAAFDKNSPDYGAAEAGYVARLEAAGSMLYPDEHKDAATDGSMHKILGFDVKKALQYVAFNRYVNNEGWGNENDFVRVMPTYAKSISELKEAVVAVEGQEYYVYMYVHNNAMSRLNLTATNVRAQFAALDKAPGTTWQMMGFITIDNYGADANGNEGTLCSYWDEVGFQSMDGRSFHMVYVLGSAVYKNNSGTFVLSDDIVPVNGTGGVLIGDTSMDGNIPGCTEHAGFVIIRVKPVYE